jgi:hypothetical protein
MTTITAKECEAIEEALNKLCVSCVDCVFDNGDNCIVIAIKSLVNEHVKEV